MNIKRLLNFSNQPGKLALFDHDWDKVADFIRRWRFDGFELLPVGNYPVDQIPEELVYGLHLRFFVFLRHLWLGDHQGLLDMFGSSEEAGRYFGGTNRECLVEVYSRQFELARRLNCRYVVFHPVQCDLAHIYDWNFPWHWRETLDICSEILNEALACSRYSGLLLFENLWWPGSFRLNHPGEYEYLRRRVNHDSCGIVLDTGHLLSSDGGFRREDEAIEHLLQRVRGMGELVREIRAVHLSCSLSGEYIRESKKTMCPDPGTGFRQQLASAGKHVSRIDRHQPFTDPVIGRLFDLIEPEQVVFEFTFQDVETWEDKISVQKKSLENILW